MMKRVLWGERKAAAMVGNGLICLTAVPMSKIMSNSNCANQGCPSYKFLSTKTPPLLQQDDGSAKLGLEGAMGLFNSFILKDPRPSVPEFDKLLEAILSSRQFSFKSRSTIVIALSKVMTSFFFFVKVMTSLEIQPSLLTLNMLLECYSSGVGRLDLGFSIFATIIKLDPDPDGAIHTTLPTGIISQGCCKKLRQGETGRNLIVAALIDNMKDGDVNRVSLKRLIDSRRARFADQLLSHKMKFCPYTCLLRGLLISSQSRAEVTTLFKKLIAQENFPDSPSVYTALNDALCQQGMMTEAHALLRHMISKKKLGLSQKLLERMIKKGHTPAPRTYQLLIDEFQEQGKPDKANTISSLLKLATDAQPQTSITIGINGIVDDTDVYCFILDGMCKAGNLNEALQLFHTLTAIGVVLNVRMYNSIISGICKEEDMLDEAVLLLRDMEQKGFKLDRFLFNTLLKRYVAHYTEVTKLMERLNLMQVSNLKFTPDPKIRSFFFKELSDRRDRLLREKFW